MIDVSAFTSQLRYSRKIVTFDGNANTGAVGSVPLFTTTGAVLVSVIGGFCTTTMVSTSNTGTLALGVTGSTAFFIAATTVNGTNFTSANAIWMSTTGTAAALAVPSGEKDNMVMANIIGTVATNPITSGVLVVTVAWVPWTADGNLA